MISGQLIAGLANVEHQGKVLAEASSLKTLKEKFEKLVSLETTDQATSHLHTLAPNQPPTVHSETAAHRSQYSQLKRLPKSTPSNQPQNSCKGCGEMSHPPEKSMAQKDCPAFTVNCHNCGIKGHLERVCCKPKQPKPKGSSSKAPQAYPQLPNEHYLFAAQFSSSVKAIRRRLHRQQQHKRWREEALAVGLPPNATCKQQQQRIKEMASAHEKQATTQAAKKEFVTSL